MAGVATVEAASPTNCNLANVLCSSGGVTGNAEALPPGLPMIWETSKSLHLINVSENTESGFCFRN